jgi:hypothetical protein
MRQKTLDRFGNTFPVQKQIILPIFVSKGQRVNIVLEKNHNQKPKEQTQENITRLGLQQEFITHMYLNLRKQSDS